MQKGIPKGWILSGSHPAEYEMGLDYEVVHQGKVSAYIKAKENVTHGGFSTLMQMFRADKYVGKRLRFTAFVKSENVRDWAGLWMRVDGKETEPLAMDNMQNRPIKNTNNWQSYSVVLDIKEGALGIAFGVLLSGEGYVWLDSIRFDEVDEKIPTTDLAENFYETLLEEPVNLQFEELRKNKKRRKDMLKYVKLISISLVISSCIMGINYLVSYLWSGHIPSLTWRTYLMFVFIFMMSFSSMQKEGEEDY